MEAEALTTQQDLTTDPTANAELAIEADLAIDPQLAADVELATAGDLAADLELAASLDLAESGPGTAVTHVAESQTFAEFGVADAICADLAAAGIIRTFPIQALTLPIALDNHDVIGQARTGTGKTYAFGVPMLQHILDTSRGKPKAPRALVVVPTRELAIQVADDLRVASASSDINVVTLYGGRAYEPQIEALATVDIVVGTPGRLLDLSRQGQLNLSAVDMLVLDEADRMLDLGFLPDVEAILRLTPPDRQTMLFSATMPSEIVTLARRHLSRPTHIRAEQQDEPAHVPTTDQHVFRAHQMDKIEVLARVLQAEGRGLTIVFCRTRRACDHVTSELTGRGFAAAAVHGDLGQSQRERALRAFRGGKIDVLVATDVAARGLDVDDVTHVVNHECPEDEKAYLHRIGRTGRAGRTGVAVTFVDWQDMHRWKSINDALKLGQPEPVETYSTSEHLFSALGIPAGATGSLPRSQRERAGIEAEDLEDIGETGKTRSRKGQSGPTGQGPRGGHGSGDDGSSRRTTRARPPRQRTRAGAPLGAAGSDDDVSGATEGSAAPQRSAEERAGDGSEAGQPRKRRRSGRGRGGRPGGSGTAASASREGSNSTRPASRTEQRDIDAS
jgi:superfamily II DNA/RNA helicase